jgi:8-hydroxy-5-deazaflavin:NADPH oxidoreductase
MAQISIIGTGKMGQALATAFAKGNHEVQTLGHLDTEALTGDIVVLAVPYGALDDVVARRGAELARKVVVDITNPVDFETFDSLTVPADASAASELAAKLPESSIVKAFNTNFAATLASGSVVSQPTTVLIAGDDAAAKDAVIAAVSSAGLSAVDAGLLRRARELEALAFLQITLAAQEKISWGAGFALIA